MRIKNKEQIENRLMCLVEGDNGSDYSATIWFNELPTFVNENDITEYFGGVVSKQDIVFCTCPDFSIREKECKHIKFVKENI